MNANDIRIGTKFEIEIPNNSRNNNAPSASYASQLLDVIDANSISVAAPMSEGRLKFLARGLNIIVYYMNERQELLFFKSTVKNHRKNGPLDAFDITIDNEPQKIQRRNFYRLDATLSSQYISVRNPVLDFDKLEFSQISQEDIKTAFTKNISVSGLCLVLENSLEAGSILDITFDLDDTAEIRVFAQVIRSIKVLSKKYEVGMNFVKIEPRDSEILRKYIFEKQRLMLKNTLQTKGK